MPDPIDIRTRQALQELKEQASHLPADEIATGGGGPHNPDMEARVAKLEEAVTAIRLDIAEMKGKISNLPTTWQLVGVNFGLAVGIGGLVFAIARAMMK